MLHAINISDLTDFLKGPAAQNYITIFGVIISILVFIWQQRVRNKILKIDNNTRKADTYARLEMASNDLFKFEAQYADILEPFKEDIKPAHAENLTNKDKTIADTFFYQTLNLFEMAIRMRKEEMFAAEIFCSWVVWYYTTLESWYFREQWEKVRENYTRELHSVFDNYVKEINEYATEYGKLPELKRRFFEHVGKKIINCNTVANWLEDINTNTYKTKYENSRNHLS